MLSMSYVLSYPSSCSPLANVLPENRDDAYSKQDGQSSVGEEQPISRFPPPVKAKRQREAVEDAEGGERQRQRKRRKTEFTQTTLVDPNLYDPFRGSPLSKAASSEWAPSQDPTRLPKFAKHTKRVPVQHLRVMDFTAGRATRRESIAQQVADQTFALEHEEDSDEEPEGVIHSKEGSLRLSSRRQEEEDFGEVAELQAPKRQRKRKLNPDSIPAVTYQSEIAFFHTLRSPLTLLSQPFELASRLGLNPELRPLTARFMLPHVLRLARLIEAVLDGEAICGTSYIQANN
jgi:hypothetical protein